MADRIITLAQGRIRESSGQISHSSPQLTPAQDDERKRKFRVPRFVADNQAVSSSRTDEIGWWIGRPRPEMTRGLKGMKLPGFGHGDGGGTEYSARGSVVRVEFLS